MNTPTPQEIPASNSSSVFSVARMLREEADLIDEQPSVEVRLTLYDIDRLLCWADSCEPFRDYHVTMRDMFLEARQLLTETNPVEDI